MNSFGYPPILLNIDMLDEASSSAVGKRSRNFLPFAGMRSVNLTSQNERNEAGGGVSFKSPASPGRLMRRLFHLLDIWRRVNERLLPPAAPESDARNPQEGRTRILRFRYDALVWTGLLPTGSGFRNVHVSVLTNNASIARITQNIARFR